MADLSRAAYSTRGLGVVDGAGADEDQQARIAMREDAGDIKARVEDGGRGLLAHGAFLFEEDRGKDNLGPLDANVFNALIHGHFLWVRTPAQGIGNITVFLRI